ncbi:uncharacterized protein LOC128277467 [Anopheles cruzii]|uniref:uncharacterized protein LOC128277467 n=1 Tax=Anopheles cruzii TaxID=68878 RepID=UPI0022EC66A6|nr:uncharacterized protein LOC128277467 [Anopheles cruzii]
MGDFEDVIDLLECPYNATHKLLSHTMARHISKCRRAHGILKLVQCPFNPEHRVPELEMTLHKLECEDREAFEQYKFCFTTLTSPTEPRTPGRRAKDTTDLPTDCGSPAAAARRRTLAAVPLASTDSPTTSPHRVYDLRTTSGRLARQDSGNLQHPASRKLPTATVAPVRDITKRSVVSLIATTAPAPTLDKENPIAKAGSVGAVPRFRTPVKISQRKLSIDDFRKHWKQVHNERRAQLRSKDRSARRSCYT